MTSVSFKTYYPLGRMNKSFNDINNSFSIQVGGAIFQIGHKLFESKTRRKDYSSFSICFA